MADCYRVDSRRITLREYWNIYPSWKVLIPWIAGRFGIRTGRGDAFRQPETVRELEISAAEFSPEAMVSLQPWLEECVRLGFHSPRHYMFASLRGDLRTSFISLLHRSGEFSIRLIHTIATGITPPKQHKIVVLMSELSDVTRLVTTNDKPNFRQTPGLIVNRLIGAALPQLVASHQQRLAEIRWKNPPRHLDNLDSLDACWDRYEKHYTDFGISRGLYVRMSPEEVDHEQRILAAAKTLAGGGTGEDSDVMFELTRLQNRKTGWGSAFWILLVSVVLFVLAGAHVWSWSFVLILLPVVFFHELGHYVAMRAFHYRNLRMFFIPFLGAAVAGQHYNVPGWKKAIVSLMGPVPGILVGVVIGIVGLVFQVPILTRIALIMLVLNGFNLLPLLPLDGGWVFHALLFCRHYLLDSAFRVITAIGLVMVGSAMDSKVLMYLSIPMFMTIPMSYRVARVAWNLRKRGLPPVSADDQTIPAGTAQAIMAQVKKIMPRVHTNKMVAEQTLQVFEILNARPPRWAASIGLLFAHAGAVAVVLVAGVLMFGAGMYPDRGSALSKFQPRSAWNGNGMDTWRGASAWNTAETPVTLIADFEKQEEASRTFRQLVMSGLPDSARVVWFGESILLALPAEESELRTQWLSTLQQLTPKVIVDESNAPTWLMLKCHLPSAEMATGLKEELQEYVDTENTQSLIPPWMPNDERSPDIPGTDVVDGRFAMRTGCLVRSEGRYLRLYFAHFTQVAEGAPGMMRWLHDKGAMDITYDFVAPRRAAAEKIRPE